MSVPAREQVLALAPDASSAKAGQAQAAPTRWPSTGTDGAHAWGECRGSGAKPYQVSVDLADLTTSCSCPSRKFPCKHGLGLLLLLADGQVGPGEPAPWTVEWRGKRAARAERRDAPPVPATAAARAQAAAERADARERAVDDGVAELQQWLEDVVRSGFATVGRQPSSWFDTTAARMVDAQARGLAERVRSIGRATRGGGTDPDRSHHALAAVGSTALLLRAWQRRDALDEQTRAQVAARLGLPAATAAVPAETVHDVWTLLGSELQDDGQLRTLRQWLLGRGTGRLATVLHFAGPGAVLDPGLADGDTEAALTLRPGPLPPRVVLGEARQAVPAAAPAVAATWAEALAEERALLERDPWLEVTAVGCRAALVPGSPWLARDADGQALPVREDGTGRAWRALARSGGRCTALAAEWDGATLRLLGVEDDRGRWTVLR